MTINEFCKMYHVSHQAVYSSILRHDEELKNHISKNSNGVKLLDDYAVEFLKPKNVSAEKIIRFAKKMINCVFRTFQSLWIKKIFRNE